MQAATVFLALLPAIAADVLCHGEGCPPSTVHAQPVQSLNQLPQSQSPNALVNLAASPPINAYEAWAPVLFRHNHWMMGYYYLHSFGAASWAEMLPDDEKAQAEYCATGAGAAAGRFAAASARQNANGDASKCDVALIKKQLRRYAAYVDLFANYHISANQYVSLLSSYSTLATPTTYMTVASYSKAYQGIKQAWAFLHWQWYLNQADWMVVTEYKPPDAKAAEYVKFVNTAATITCWYAFYEWHVSNRMELATMAEPAQAVGAKLMKLFWDEAFIHTVHHVIMLKLWHDKFPEHKGLKAWQPIVARNLAYIAFAEVYWGAVASYASGVKRTATGMAQMAQLFAQMGAGVQPNAQTGVADQAAQATQVQ